VDDDRSTGIVRQTYRKLSRIALGHKPETPGSAAQHVAIRLVLELIDSSLGLELFHVRQTYTGLERVGRLGRHLHLQSVQPPAPSARQRPRPGDRPRPPL